MSERKDAPDEIEIRPFEPGLRADFQRLMDTNAGCAWCRCVAWWVPTWEGFSDRSAEENRCLREELLERGEYDGYLAYRDGRCVAWCQVGPRDRLSKLAEEHDLTPDPTAFAISCFYVLESERERGVARALLRGVLADLDKRSVQRVEAFPRSAGDHSQGELWTGPLALFEKHGFQRRAGHARRILMVRELPAG